MDERRLTVPEEDQGERLDAWLARRLGESRSVVARWIDTGMVRVGDVTPNRSLRLKAGQDVDLRTEESRPILKQSAPTAQILFEDPELLVVDKPAGLVVHPAGGHRDETLVDQLASRTERRYTPLLVHRLDRNTSGVMLVAKDESTQQYLQDLLRSRELERQYLALVCGAPASRTGTIDAPIGRDRRNRTRMSVDTDKPRSATTHFEVVEELDGHTLLELRLETGRTHQIRAHLKAIGLPIYGDREYGSAAGDLNRQFLHSARLTFEMPHTGKQASYVSDLPPELEAVLRSLRSREADDR